MSDQVAPLDWFHIMQAGSYFFTSLAAVVAALKYNADRNVARKMEIEEGERKKQEIEARLDSNAIAARDLRWRKMEAAQRMLDAMSVDDGYVAATTMLDWSLRRFLVDGDTVEIDQQMMLRALRTTTLDFNRIEVFVRDSFDSLFYMFERVNHQIELEMIAIEFVSFPLRYYACRIAENRAVFDNYLEAYTFAGAKKLIDKLLLQPGSSPIPHSAPAS